jgi:hypothetical protein
MTNRNDAPDLARRRLLAHIGLGAATAYATPALVALSGDAAAATGSPRASRDGRPGRPRRASRPRPGKRGARSRPSRPGARGRMRRAGSVPSRARPGGGVIRAGSGDAPRWLRDILGLR